MAALDTPAGSVERAELLLRLAVHTGLCDAARAAELWARVRAGAEVRSLLRDDRAATAEELEALADVAAGLVRRGLTGTLPRLLTAADTVATGTAAGGDRLGPYRLAQEIGRGGMAIVYRARHEGLQRDVALKVIRPGLEQDLASLARFRLEAQAAAALADHPGIVAARDVGEADGRLYFVMDLVEGATLEELTANADVTLRDVARYLAAAARAVHYAHTQGILHRDVKPGNILIGTDGRVRLTDFGLAKIAALADAGHTALTRAGAVLGTPAYMSPEQALGRPLDARTDVYSLGATLWHALVGEAPWSGESPERIVAHVREDDLPPPSRRNAAVPRDLETITLCCCERSPGGRYPTAEALAEDLERFARGETIAARTPGAWARWRRRVRRNPAPWVAGAVAASAVAVAAGVVAWQTAAERAALAVDLASARLLTPTDPDAALGILGRLANRASALPGLAAARDAATARRTTLARERALAQAALPLDQARRALAAYRTADAELATLPIGGTEATRKTNTHHAELAGATAATADGGRTRERVLAERERHYVIAWAGYQAVRDLLAEVADTAEGREAADALAELACARLLEAERDGDDFEAVRFAADLAGLGDPRYERTLEGSGTLTLSTDPGGATVEAWRCRDTGGRLVASRRGELGTTPLDAVPLPMGSWILVLRAPGRAEVRYPVLVERTETEVVPAPIPLPAPAQVGDGYVYVPPGESILGGDSRAYDSGPRRRVWVDGFCLARHEVTNGEYRAFLQAALDQGNDPAEVQRLSPTDGRRSYLWRVVNGGLVDVVTVGPDWPVSGVSWDKAAEYCRWRSVVEGRPVTLPAEDEWERAARGADGRWYPWGRGFDWSWTVGARSPVHDGRPQPRPVGSTSTDCSPFGLFDLGGSVRECCAPRADAQAAQLVAGRGGSWASQSPNDFRSSQREYGDRNATGFAVGFRCRAPLYPR